MAEETIRVSFQDDASAPAGIAAEALDRVDRALEKLDGKEAKVETGGINNAAAALQRLRDVAERAGSAIALALHGIDPGKVGAATAAAVKLSSVFDLMKNRADELRAAQARAFSEMEIRGSRLPTALQPGAAPKKINWFSGGPDGERSALETVSTKAGSALEAASHDALEMAVSLSKAEIAAKKLSSVYDLIEKRAAAAAKAEARVVSEMEARGSRLPTALQPGAAPKEQNGFQKLVGLVGKVFGNDAAGGLTRGAALLSEASDKLGPLGPVLGKGGSLIATGAGALAAAGAQLVQAAAEVAVKLLIAGAQLAISATSFREKTLAGLEAVTKSAGLAKDALDTAVKLSIDLDLDKEKTVERVKGLLTAGFKNADLKAVITSVADITVAKGEQAGDALAKQLEKIKSLSKFNTGSIDALGEAGVQADKVYQALAKQMGTTVDVVKGKVNAGLVSSADGIKAILAAVNQQAGGAAAKAAGNVQGMVNGLKTRFESIFELDEDAIAPLKAALGSLGKLLDGDAGANLKAAANKLFGTIFSIIGKAFSGPEGEARLNRLLTGAAKAMEGAAVIIESAGPKIIEIIDGISKIVDRSGSSTGGSWFQSLAEGALALSLALMGVNEASGSAKTIIDALVASGGDVQGAFMNIGAQIIGGLVGGIMKDAASVAAALDGVVTRAVLAVQQRLGIASPSRVFAQIGDYSAQGLAMGFDRRGSLVANAGQNMVAAALSGSAAAANDNSLGAAGAGGGGGGNVTIVVQIQAGPGVTRDQAQAMGAAAGDAAYRQWRGHMGRFVRDGRQAA